MKLSQLYFSHSKPRLGSCALVTAMLFAGAAHAQDGGPSIRFSGFGTLGIAHSSEKNADFTSVSDQPNGAGYTRSWAFNTDSKLAGQADIKFGDQFSATAQLMTRQRYDKSYTPELMMAFGKWQATPSLAVRIGRLPISVFLISDSRNIGYSQAQLRPPVDMYNVFGLYHLDGADLTWTTNFGGVALKSQINAGTIKGKLPGSVHMELSPSASANLTGEIGDLTLRVSYLGAKVSLSAPGLDGAFQGVRTGLPAGSLGSGSPAIPGDPALADQYELRNKFSSFTSVGFNYDPGKWFVTGELGVISAAAFGPKRTIGYLSGGMRFGTFTPYGTVSRFKTDIGGSTTNNPVVDALRAASTAIGQKSLSLGLRWDAMKNVAVKTEFNHVKTDRGSTGLLTNIQPGFQPGTGYNVYSAAVDFVF